MTNLLISSSVLSLYICAIISERTPKLSSESFLPSVLKHRTNPIINMSPFDPGLSKPLVADSSSVRTPPEPIPDVCPKCQEMLATLAESFSNFTFCTLINARPVKMCRECSWDYDRLMKVFQNISQYTQDDCENELFNRDRLMIAQSSIESAQSLWSNAICQNCFQNDELPELYRLSNVTVEFFNKLQEVMNCVKNSKVLNVTVDAEDICKKCGPLYQSLNQLYNKMNTNNDNMLCMDIVDAMNITRHQWNNEFHCKEPSFRGFPVLILSGMLSLFPVVFYLLNYFCSSPRESELLRQKRMSYVNTSYGTRREYI